MTMNMTPSMCHATFCYNCNRTCSHTLFLFIQIVFFRSHTSAVWIEQLIDFIGAHATSSVCDGQRRVAYSTTTTTQQQYNNNTTTIHNEMKPKETKQQPCEDQE